MVICLERGADLHMAKLMPLPHTVSCFSKIQIGFTFLVPAHLGSPGKGLLNGCVCVLEMCGISGIEAFLLQSQFRWGCHIVRMPDFRIPKQAFFGQLARGCRLQGGPVRRYKDSLKINLRACDLAPSVLRTTPLDSSVCLPIASRIDDVGIRRPQRLSPSCKHNNSD